MDLNWSLSSVKVYPIFEIVSNIIWLCFYFKSLLGNCLILFSVVPFFWLYILSNGSVIYKRKIVGFYTCQNCSKKIRYNSLIDLEGGHHARWEQAKTKNVFCHAGQALYLGSAFKLSGDSGILHVTISFSGPPGSRKPIANDRSGC